MQHRFRGKLLSIVGKKNAEILKNEFYFYSTKKNINAAANDLITEKMLDVIFGKVIGIVVRNNDMSDANCLVDVLYNDYLGEEKYITFEIQYKDSWETVAS